MTIPIPTFRELGILPETADALEDAGIVTPFPIQSLTLPVALSGHDVIGQAKTGTGKTLGFGIPLLQRVAAPNEPAYDDLPSPGAPQALVVVPTRELCVQVTGDLKLAGKRRPVRVLSVYGGRAYEPQVASLKVGVDIVVGTPGRLIDLAKQGYLDLGHVRMLVLDEADEMLDLGFLPDVERIVRLTPAGRQTMLFSATMPGEVISLARQYMTQPTHIRAVDPDDSGAMVKAVEQHVFRAHAMDKVEMLARLLQAEGRGLTLVFCRTKRTAAKVADDLVARGFAAGAVHGDLGQGAREQALRAFRSGKVDVLVATDVAARGIDVDDVTHVVNYQCPEDEKTYLHRIGRTARAGKPGIAVTFVDWDDLHRWTLIDKAHNLGMGDPEETYSSSPHYFDVLRIPAGMTGVLPRANRTRAGLGAEEVEDLGETGRHGGGRDGGPSRDGGRGRGGTGRGSASRGSADRGSTDRGSTDRGSTDRGSTDRGPADRGSHRSRTEDSADAPRRPRRSGSRRRTRSGEPVTGAPATGATESAAAPTGEGSRPRQRRRGGRGRRGASTD
jgi:superfamily II DNA/RNA helicase